MRKARKHENKSQKNDSSPTSFLKRSARVPEVRRHEPATTVAFTVFIATCSTAPWPEDVAGHVPVVQALAQLTVVAFEYSLPAPLAETETETMTPAALAVHVPDRPVAHHAAFVTEKSNVPDL